MDAALDIAQKLVISLKEVDTTLKAAQSTANQDVVDAKKKVTDFTPTYGTVPADLTAAVESAKNKKLVSDLGL